jgi:Transcription factor zinc-finger
MEDTKDRLGKKLSEREKAEEDRFFEQQEQEKIAKLKAAQEAAMAAPVPGKGNCPWCGTPLAHVKLHGIGVEQCPKDCGIWLAVDQVETLAQREHDGWLAKYFYRPRLDG